jgi:hypothetical protein
MKSSDDFRDVAASMMEAFKQYGRDFLIFEPEDQPNVFKQAERDVPVKFRSGNINPQALQHWSHLDTTRNLLRERYGLFQRANLVIDCPLDHASSGERSRTVFMLIVFKGMIGFKCRARNICSHKHCTAKTRSMLDIYDLIALLDGKNLNHAKKVVSDYFEVKLGSFSRAETDTGENESGERSDWMRYAVSKVRLRNLFGPSLRVSKGTWVEGFIARALELICTSPEEAYDGYNGQTKTAVLFSKKFDWKTKLPELGASARLFIWLHWQQAQAGKSLSFTDDQLAWALNVSKRTIVTYKQQLLSRGYLVANEKEKTFSVRYEPDP